MKLLFSTLTVIGTLSFSSFSFAQNEEVTVSPEKDVQDKAVIVLSTGAGHGKVCSIWDQFIGKCQKN